MKAMVIREYGEPHVMKLEDMAQPSPKAGEVLVRLYATSVNPFDLNRRSGAAKEQAPITFPGVVGVDVAGIVQSLGEGVEGVSVGDNVLCMADRTYAELCAVPAASVVRMPGGMDLYAGAAIPLVTTTGKMLAEAAGNETGKTVLVTGAVGNVGRSAVYALQQSGAHVIAGVLASQVREASAMGVDRVIATDDPAAVQALGELDAVADTIGGKLAEMLLTKVKPGGVFASVLGPPKTAKDHPAVTFAPVGAVPNAAILAAMVEAVQAGELTIPVVKQYPLADAVQAHEDTARGAIHGKALLIADADGAATATATSEVKALLAAYNTALNESDTDKVISLYTADGIFMGPFSPSSIGLEAIRKAYGNVFATLKFNVVFHIMELVVLSPEYAYARTNSVGSTTNPSTGAESSEGNQELFLFRREGGAWKIARYSFSPVGSPSA